jgi:hypothetical protein
VRAVNGDNVSERLQRRRAAANQSLPLQAPGGNSIQSLRNFAILVIRRDEVSLRLEIIEQPSAVH